MRKQCVPGSTSLPRNEPGHEAMCDPIRFAFGCIHVGAVVVDPYSLAMDSHRLFHAFWQEAGSKAVTIQCA